MDAQINELDYDNNDDDDTQKVFAAIWMAWWHVTWCGLLSVCGHLERSHKHA